MPEPTPSRPLVRRIFEYPGHLWNWVHWKTGFCRRLRRYPPVFVYQMGKVASQSIHEPLRDAYPGEVIHGHVFSPDYPQGEVKELYRYWEQRNRRLKMPLISLTREPVGRNVSAFFQNFETYTGMPVEAWTRPVEDLLEVFLQEFPHHIPEIWFDRSIKQNFGVDVFSVPFPAEGTCVIPHAWNPLLVIRMEADDEVKTHAVREFLQVPGFSTIRRNQSAGKEYGSLYEAFRKGVKLPGTYVEQQTSTRYFRHFYGDEVRKQLFSRWCS